MLPGPQGSDFALQDFASDVGVVRLRRDVGRSFVSMLATGRQIDHGGDNVVIGPDFQWRPRAGDSVTGQALYSRSRTPRRPDLADEWDGRTLSDRAAQLSWSHNTRRLDWYLQGQDIGREFRADNGFIPQVGYREAYSQAGYTFRPKDTFLSRVRVFTENFYDREPGGHALTQRLSVGSGMDGKWNSFLRVELDRDNFRVGDRWLQRFRPRLMIQASPGSFVNQFSIDSYVGGEVDFANGREGKGTTVLTSFTLRPGPHLELRGNADRRSLNVHPASGPAGRVFTATVERLRATWSFNSRAFIRLIGQYVVTRRDTALYAFTVPAKTAGLSASGLFAYKLNWQTVLYTGYGDARQFDEVSDRLQKSGRQAFAKVSYAWQH